MLGDLRATGTSYSRLVQTGRIKPEAHTLHVRAAGTSTTVFDESAAVDVQPDIYFPIPPTPPELRHFRDERTNLVVPDIRHGRAAERGESVQRAFVAGQKTGIQQYLSNFAERNYAAVKLEPLGKAIDRGYDIPEGLVFGDPANPNGAMSAKEVIFPRTGLDIETLDAHKLYVKTHKSFAPGEQLDREYQWPEGVNPDAFSFGHADAAGTRSTKDALTWERSDAPTKVVLKRLEDYRAVSKDPLGEGKNHMQWPLPVPTDFRFGARSNNSNNTVAHCLQFNNKSESELVPDRNLGTCDVQGKRNSITDRVYGLPSIRTDIPKPELSQRSVADVFNYGDDLGTYSLLHPQRFQNMGVSDEQFLQNKNKVDMHQLVQNANLGIDDATFDKVWMACHQEDVNIKDFLQAYCKVVVDAKVAQRFGVRNTINHGI